MNKKAQWAFSPAFLNHSTPGSTIPYFYVAQHTNQRDEKCDGVTEYFDYCFSVHCYLFCYIAKNKQTNSTQTLKFARN